MGTLAHIEFLPDNSICQIMVLGGDAEGGARMGLCFLITVAEYN